MSKRKLQQMMFAGAPDNVTQIVSPRAFERWSASVQPVKAAADSENTIDMLDVIGEDWWTGGGITAKGVRAQLKAMKGDVTVRINSPGGLVGEGNAIYNMLRDHDGKITVKVLGMAASIASIIAMAGDEIQIAKSGFMMLHNCSAVALGTRHEMQAALEWFTMIDETMRDIYSERSGIPTADLGTMMDRETFMRGETAIAKGLADKFLASDEVKASERAQATPQPALQQIDTVLARAGVARADRRNLFAELKSGTPSAADAEATPSAGSRAEIDVQLERLALIKVT